MLHLLLLQLLLQVQHPLRVHLCSLCRLLLHLLQVLLVLCCGICQLLISCCLLLPQLHLV